MDNTADILERVETATANGRKLNIVGAGSKAFYGRSSSGELLDMSSHSGVIAHEPADLVITVRAGTTLDELDQVLSEEGQVNGFEPPRFGGKGTLGGAVASGLSGPRRPWAGAARDFVLGLRCLNSAGQQMRFGGTLIKNVAGYDISRMMAGSMGTLGVLLDISLRVMPAPKLERTQVLEMGRDEALQFMNRVAGRPLPLSAAVCVGEQVCLRFSGSEQGVTAACQEIGGEELDDASAFWCSIRDHQHRFFISERPLWRLSVAPASPMLDLPGDWLLDWGGAQRWLKTELAPAEVFQAAAKVGGHATLFRGGDRDAEVFQPLNGALKTIHQRVKKELDPAGVFNPGRMYGDC